MYSLRRPLPLVESALVCAALVAVGAGCRRAAIEPGPEALALTPPEVLAHVRADAFAYFRFLNRPWNARVCEAFATDLATLPMAHVHGDAHIEQFAVTEDAWGLDDFDDSARGAAVVDIVRFLGSIDLASRERGWTGDRERLFDRFVSGYRRGLTEPDAPLAPPAIVGRLRSDAPATRTTFLTWGDSKMQPMTEPITNAVVAGMSALAGIVLRERPDLGVDYFRVVRAGWLRMGIGSATGRKILIRVQGASAAPDDDELLEAKEVGSLSGLRCLDARAPEPSSRIIEGARELGRLKHHIMEAGATLEVPEVVLVGSEFRNWWIRSWDPSYREVRVADLTSADDLASIAFDSGVQLGAGRVRNGGGPIDANAQARELEALARLEPRMRRESTMLVDDLMRGWSRFRER